MARKVIDIGTIGNDGTGDSIRDSFRKVNDNFRELYSSLGLGERLTFIGLDDTPSTFNSQENSILTVNTTEDGISFRRLEAGTGIQIDFDSNPNSIVLSNLLSDISGDPTPNLGGPLNAQFGVNRSPIGNLPDLSSTEEVQAAKSVMQGAYGELAADPNRLAANKGYVDTKLALAGVDAIDPATGGIDNSFGIMTGPLVLSRDPIPEDDDVWDGRVAATKRYVDSSGFGSSVNLYVATSGQDDRANIDRSLQGRALSFAYRTIEAALKKAEELVLEAPIEMGPYKKVLTYNNGAGECFLKQIGVADESGVGFSSQLFMSADTIKINNRGSLYLAGDILTISGGTSSQAATIQVLSVNVIGGTGGRGSISAFKVLTYGVYTALPGATNVATTSNSDFGTGATFDITYKVNNIQVTDGGSGYGLVSVRIVGGGGYGAFGRATVVNGTITGISVTNKGSGFTSLPNVIVNLPRFFIETYGFRTDFTGNVLSSTPEAVRTRDIREGLLLRGETSGALAQILGHRGELSVDSETVGCEIFDVDLLSGEFIDGEVIAFGDVTKPIQISILVESGIYEENFPLRVPQNIAIIGDEFRRTIIRPKGEVPGAQLSGISTSPWAFLNFRRDPVIDGLTVADQLYGYHYLENSQDPVYPFISNNGGRFSAATLLDLNREFIKGQIIGWINHQVANNVVPFTDTFDYNQELCRRDVGLIIDAIAFDLKHSGYARTISAALKYYTNASSVLAIESQLSQTVAAIERINVLAQDVIANTQITTLYTASGDQFELGDPNITLLSSQVVEPAYVAETSANTIIASLINAIVDIISNSGAANYPKDNKKLDVFLCNDANIIRAVTCQGHGGFMMVLDPEGQILTKSPYCQEAASFSQSKGRKAFHGGMFVDGFTGNQQFRITDTPSTTTLNVDGFMRIPQTPCSFIVNDTVYRINYVRNYNYAIDYPTAESEGTSQWYSSAQLILDETTPWPFGTFDYDREICRRDVGLIIDGLGYDIALNTNFHQRRAGISYHQYSAQRVIDDQQKITTRSITFAHEKAASVINTTNTDILTAITDSNENINTVIETGVAVVPVLVMTNPPGVSTNVANAKSLLLSNIDFIKAETIGWIAAQVSGNIAPFASSFTYNANLCARDVGLLVEAVTYDLLYGGNSQTREAAQKYFDGVGNALVDQLAAGQKEETVAAINYASYLCQQVVQNLAPATTYTSTPRVTGTAATSAEATIIGNLLTAVSTVVTNGVGSLPVLVLPNLSAYSYDAARVAARNALVNNKTTIQADTIFWINMNANQYEILMPGNRSMLSNDFTQVNDLGYGLIVANGGLTEAVSMFTYYCHISYYALTGGQIRSVGGSSSHGNYALVAEGSDPLEVPTPAGLYHKLAQGATVFANTVSTLNAKGSTDIWVIYDDYFPLSGSEIEVSHNNLFTRYAVSSVTLIDQAQKLVRLSISSAGGLEAGIPHGQRVSLRMNSFVVLTGDIVDVATRPSTALVLNDGDFVYRVLELNEYSSTYDLDVFTVTDINLTSGIITTDVPHRQSVGYQVVFDLGSGDTLPTAIVANQDGPPQIVGNIYYVESVIDPYRFTLTAYKSGPLLDLSAGPAYSGAKTTKMRPYGLALAQLRENYSYSFLDLYPAQPFRNPGSLTSCTFAGTTPTVVSATGHGLVAGNQIRFDATGGSLPTGISTLNHYWVVSKDLTANSFKITTTPPIYSTQVGVNGTLTGVTITGLVSTTRLLPGMRLVPKSSISITSVVGDGTTATITFSQKPRPPFNAGQTINVSGVTNTGFNNSSAVVISCTTTSLTYANTTSATSSGGTVSTVTTGNLGTNPVIVSVTNPTTIIISNGGGSVDGTVVFDVEGAEIGVPTTGSNVKFGKVIGDQGQTTVAITDLPAPQEARILNSVILYEGTEYKVTSYQERPNGALYSLVTLDKPLDISAIAYSSPISLRAGVSVPSAKAIGTLTIRISLVRVTSHDFLEIGTGGYADTNYPSEIYGQPVNDFNSVPIYSTDFDSSGLVITRAQVQERDVGRCFFVTTDQYGNFSVGPFFKVDQGTGTVTFAASIALSQLDGLGFKRGATISEFSVDDSMADAANDTVPTEGAVRGYIDRRLGLTHDGTPVLPESLIPIGSAGGFLALSGQLAMKGDLDLGTFKVRNVGTPILDTDVVRLQDLTIGNIKDQDGQELFAFTQVSSGQLLALTGDKNNIGNFTPVGDVVFSLDAGDSTTNVIHTSISPGVIVNTDINDNAAISQSKLSLNAATTRANATGITQAERGLSSFDSAQFEATSGWITVRDNGLVLSKVEQIGAKTVLGNSGAVSANVSQVNFTTVVADGGAVKKSQYSSGVGYLKRTNSTNGAFTDDGHYSIINDDSNKSVNTLVRRDANGDFAGRNITLDQLNVATTSTGTYTVLKSNELSQVAGYTELYGYNGGGGSTFAGVQIGAGTGNNKTLYNNTGHEFRSQNGATTYATLDSSGFNLGTRTLTTTAITTGSDTTAGTITGQWILASTPNGATRGNSRLQATYAADLAEFYEGDAEYDTGTVLVFGGEKEVTESTSYADRRVAGVVSNNAAYSMNGACPGLKNQIALQGRVPVKVVGKINKGDILVTSDIPGVATAAGLNVVPGTMIGKALETYDSTEVGTIEVAVGRT